MMPIFTLFAARCSFVNFRLKAEATYRVNFRLKAEATSSLGGSHRIARGFRLQPEDPVT
jgi:hypothetical protein